MKSLLPILFITVFITSMLRSQNANSTSTNSAVSFTSSNLPIVVIDTHGKTIVNEPKIVVDMGIIYNGEGVRNNLTDAQNNYKGKVGIEIRGSTSQWFPKKQYAVEARTSSDADTSVSLLGLPEDSDWILYAPYTDKTFFRDALVYWLSASIGRYASRFKFCELVLNGEYMGVYILFEKIKRGKNRVDISKMTSADSTGDDLTGGYMLKIDKEDGSGNDGWKSPYPPYLDAYQKIYWQFHYPKPEDITTQQKIYIQNFIDTFETALYNPTFADSLLGYPSIIDVPSFVDYFLLNEMCKNVDAYRLSAFLYKDKDSKNPKLFMGPVWDYNLAWGNSDYYDASLIYGWHISYLTTNTSYLRNDQYQVPFWWKKLYTDSNFKINYAKRWFALRKNEFNLSRINSFIDSLRILLDEASVRNFQRWQILGTYVWPNYYIGQTYDDEMNYFTNWIANRLTWMDNDMKNIDGSNETADEKPAAFTLFQNYPNPFNPETSIKYQLSENGLVQLKVFDLLGNQIALPVNEFQLSGSHSVNFTTGALSSGIYFYQLKTGGRLLTKKMMILR